MSDQSQSVAPQPDVPQQGEQSVQSTVAAKLSVLIASVLLAAWTLFLVWLAFFR